MGALVTVLTDACNEELEKISNSILGEMKGIVGAHSRSGQALAAVHMESTGAMSRFVGGTHLHLYYLNEGNGGSMIYPKSAQALRFSDGSFHAHARPYAGIHFVEEIASHYG